MLLVACFIKEGFMKKKTIRLSYSYIITAVICALALLFSFVANSFALTSHTTAQSTQQQTQKNQQNQQANTPPHCHKLEVQLQQIAMNHSLLNH